MDNNPNAAGGSKRASSKPEANFYEIKVQGELGPAWSRWFDEMTLTVIENGETGMAYTVISGPVCDQPALHGLLNKIRDLNLTLISVCRRLPGANTVEEIPIDLE